MGYNSFVLTEKTRQAVLGMFPAKHPHIKAEHITYKFGVGPEEPMPNIKYVTVYGYAEDQGIQCLVVTVNGQTHRKDDNGHYWHYHLTLSFNPEISVPPSFKEAGYNQELYTPFCSNFLLKTQGFTESFKMFGLVVQPMHFNFDTQAFQPAVLLD